MSRVVFLGIDGLDPSYIEANLDHLPTFRRLASDGLLTRLPSIFPPDSIPAWITIFTGKPPASHGVIESIDYLAKRPAHQADRAPALLRGRTFWDAVSAAGRRVCVVNPFMAFPAWPVEGVMVSGPVFIDSKQVSVVPAGALDGLDSPELGGIVDFPTERTMHEFLTSSLKATVDQAAFGLELFKRVEPDLFFINILTIDRIQHFLWRYADPGDPTYPGETDLTDSVLRAYELIDGVVGNYFEQLRDGDVLFVASDHGHGRRPSRMLYVDELLRRHGFFKTGRATKGARTYALEKAKRGALAFAARCGIEDRAYAVARRIPGRKALKTSSYAKGSATVASASRALGRNSAGGIEVAPFLEADAKDRIAKQICALLLDVVDDEGRLVCEWAQPRDEVVHGPYAACLPEVLFQLREDIGVDFGVFGPLFGTDNMHRRVSGGHKKNGIFAASSSDLPFVPTGLDQLHRLLTTVAVGTT